MRKFVTLYDDLGTALNTLSVKSSDHAFEIVMEQECDHGVYIDWMKVIRISKDGKIERIV